MSRLKEPESVPADDAPPVRRPRSYAAMTAAFLMCGASVAAASALVAAQSVRRHAGGLGDLAAIVLGLILGYLGGVGLGVVLARRVLHQDGSTAGGMVGAVLGAVFVLLAAEPLRLNAESEVLLVTYALCVAVFAAVGFYSRS